MGRGCPARTGGVKTTGAKRGKERPEEQLLFLLKNVLL
jgi:hypothetical protein